MEKEEILIKLNAKKSADRRRAAKAIGKFQLAELGDELYEAYLREKKDKRTWETQKEMIRALGIITHKNALSSIQEIVELNVPFDAITSASATTLVQLKRESLQDASPVLELLDMGSVSVISGALYALAVDKMIPSETEIEQPIKKCWNIHKHPDREGEEYGSMDPRVYLAFACAGWEKKLTETFLLHCIETAYNINRFGKPVENTKLMDVCKNSLEGKYSKGYF